MIQTTSNPHAKFDCSQFEILIDKMKAGDLDAREELARVAYQRLWSIASNIIGPQFENPSWTPTALVGEGFAKLLSKNSLQNVNNAKHFFSLFACAMRHSLIDYNRSKNTEKRGGDMKRLDLDVVLSWFSKNQMNIEQISDALDNLHIHSPQAADILEMQCFGFMKITEIVDVTKLPKTTVETELRFAKAFVRDQLISSGAC